MGSAPVMPMTSRFYCRIHLYSKKGDVCRKLEFNMLKNLLAPNGPCEDNLRIL